MLSKLVPQFVAVRRPVSASVRRLFTALTCAVALSSTVGAHGQVTTTAFEDAPNHQQDVFYRGVDQHIYFRYFSADQGWQVQDVTTLAGAPLAAPATHVSSFKDDFQNQQHVVFEAANGHIYQAWSNTHPSVWTFQDVTAITGSGGAAVASPLVSYASSSTGIQYIFSVGADQHIRLFYWFGSWTAVDATAAAKAVPAVLNSNMAGFLEAQSNMSHIFYQGADLHVHELYAGLNPAAIQTTDNSAEAGATPTLAGAAMVAHFDPQTQQEHVFFIGVDQHVHHLEYAYAASVWTWEDLTGKAGSVAAGVGSALASFQDAARGQFHVTYVGTDQHLHQLYNGTQLADQDITRAASAVIPASLTSLAAFKDDPDNQQHAFFVGADAHFYHLYFDTHWNVQDLTTGAALPDLQIRAQVSVSASLHLK